MTFETIGYFKEYYTKDAFVGSVNIKENDQDGFGYKFREFDVAEQDFKVGKRKILKGQEYFTIVMPLCGKKK